MINTQISNTQCQYRNTDYWADDALGGIDPVIVINTYISNKPYQYLNTDYWANDALGDQ